MMKTWEDYDMTNHIDFVYAEIENQPSGLIWLGAVLDENKTGQ